MKISIVTVCLNAENFIKDSIKSVLNQSYKDIEYIIIDGGSSDKTLDILNEYKDKISILISEKDKGVYDAMNKAVRLSTGEVLYFLGADDRLHDSKVIEDVMQYFMDNQGDVIYGTVQLIGHGTSRNPQNPVFIGLKSTFKDWLDGCCHQRVFVKKKIFDSIGLFDLNYPVHSDWDWLLRAYKRGFKFFAVERKVAFYYAQGMSFKNMEKTIFERYQILFHHAPFGFFLNRVISSVIARMGLA